VACVLAGATRQHGAGNHRSGDNPPPHAFSGGYRKYPPEAGDRLDFSSAIGTLVERTTRFTMLLHLPRMEGHGAGTRLKNGPALAGHGAEAVRDEIARLIATLTDQLRRSLTWDQGAEMAQHAQLRIDTGFEIYFCDPHRPWQARHQREHQRAAAPVLPQGHRPVSAFP
jgi:hypothetical protein